MPQSSNEQVKLGHYQAADALVYLFEKLLSLNTAQRFRVYKRWEMLKLIQLGDIKKWESELKRITKP